MKNAAALISWGLIANLTPLCLEGFDGSTNPENNYQVIESEWLGKLIDVGQMPLLWHAEHGWIYVLGDDESSLFLYDVSLENWWWSGNGCYPVLYKYGQNADWYWYHRDSKPGGRTFTRLSDRQLIRESDLGGQTPANSVASVFDTFLTLEEGAQIDVDLRQYAHDPDGDTLVFNIVDTPKNGVLTGGPPFVSYQPDPDYHGPDVFTFQVNDGILDSTVAHVFLSVVQVNRAPLVQNGSLSLAENGAVSVSLADFASDPDGDLLTFTIVQAPGHGILSLEGELAMYTPNEDYHGPDSFRFKASDGSADSESVTISIDVNSVNAQPTASGGGFLVQENGSLDIDLRDMATDPDGDNLTFSIVETASHGTVSLNGHQITYVPAPNYRGSDAFSFKASDGSLESAPAILSLVVYHVNREPTTSGGFFTLQEDGSVLIDLSDLATDPDGDTLAYTIVATPENGILSGDAPVVSYQPDPGYWGPDGFSFMVSDGILDSTTSAVSFYVNAVNEAPVTRDGTLTLDQNGSISFSLADYTTDADGDPVAFTIVESASHGTVSLSGDEVTYAPASDFHGSDSFRFTASDGSLDSEPATISLIVHESGNAGGSTDSIVLWYGFDRHTEAGETDFLVLDKGLRGNDATCSSGTNPAWTGNGLFDGAYAFDGTNQFLQTASGELKSADAFSFSLWMKNANPVISNRDMHIILWQGEGNGNGGGAHYEMSLNLGSVTGTSAGAGSIQFHIEQDGTNAVDESDINILETFDRFTDWHHIVVVVDGFQTQQPEASLYLDGQLIGSDTSGPIPTGSWDTPLRIGNPGTGDRPYNGLLDELLIVERPFAPQEIANLYQEGLDILANGGGGTLNNPPQTTGATFSTVKNTPLQVNLSAYSSDPDGDTLSYTVVVDPANGSMKMEGAVLTYTPANGYVGEDFICFKAYDGDTYSNESDMRISVVAGNSPPVASDSAHVLTQDNSLALNLGDYVYDPDGDTLVYTILDRVSNGILEGTAPDLVYTPDAGYTGPDAFSYKVSDGEFESAEIHATISVKPVVTDPGAYDVFAIAGQSNAKGNPEYEVSNRANTDLPNLANNIAYVWDSSLNNIRPVRNEGPGRREAIGHPANEYDHGGSWNAFAKRWHELTGRKMVFIQGAVGGSGVVSGVAYPGGNWADTHAATMISDARAMFQRLDELGINYNFRGFLWHQGESDAEAVAGGTSTVAAYKIALRELFERFASEFSGRFNPVNPEHAFVSMQLLGSLKGKPADGFGPDMFEWQLTRAAQEELSRESSLARVVAWDAVYSAPDDDVVMDTMWDSVHYTQNLYNQLGEHTADELYHPGWCAAMVPEGPANLTASTRPNLVRLNWSPHPGDHRGTRIYRKVASSGEYELVYQLAEDIDGLFIDMEGVENGTTYDYKVVHFNEWGDSDPTEVTVNLPPVQVPQAFVAQASPALPQAVANLMSALQAKGYDEGLVRLYPMSKAHNAGTGNTVYDVMRGADLTMSGDIQWGTNGLVFDGSQKYLVSEDASILPFTGEFTFLTIYKPDSLGGTQNIFGSKSMYNCPRSSTAELTVKAGGVLGAFFNPDYDLHQSGGGIVQANVPDSICMVYDNMERRTYYGNSTAVRMRTKEGLYPRTEQVNGGVGTANYIGANSQGNNNLKGTLSFVAVWNRALTAEEYTEVRTIIKNSLGL